MRYGDRNRIFGSRAAVLLGAVILAFAAFGSARELYQNYLLQKEIRALLEDAARLEANHSALLSAAEKIGRGEFLEDEARVKLGLQKPGEQVVVVRGLAEQAGQIDRELSNPQRWLGYFIHGDGQK